MFWIIVLVVAYFAMGWVVRKMGKAEIYYCFIPAGTTAEVVSLAEDLKKAGTGSKTTLAGGGDIINLLHAIQGYKILKRGHDKSAWRMVKGFQIRNPFYYLFGVQKKGWYTDLRVSKVREFRFSMDDEETDKKEKDSSQDPNAPTPEYRVHAKSYETKFVYFRREHAVEIKGAETGGAFQLDVLVNVLYEETRPIHVRLDTADPNAVLSTLVDQSMNNMTGSQDPEYYIFGKQNGSTKSAKEHRQELALTIEREVREEALATLGITVTKVIIVSIEMDAATRELLELQERTRREMAAAVQKATQEVEIAAQEAAAKIKKGEAAKKIGMMRNDVQADHVNRVILPVAREPGAAGVRFAEAYEKNDRVTTFAPGGQMAQILSDQSRPKKDSVGFKPETK